MKCSFGFSVRSFAISVFGQILHRVGHGLENIFQPGIVEPALFGISLRQPKGPEQYLVVEGKNGALFQKGPGLFDCLDGITR